MIFSLKPPADRSKFLFSFEISLIGEEFEADDHKVQEISGWWSSSSLSCVERIEIGRETSEPEIKTCYKLGPGPGYHQFFTMRAAIILSVVALAAGAPKKLSSKFLSTPMARGGGQIVGGTEASPGEFPHQIALLRGGVGGSLICGGSLIGPMKVVTAGHCCDGSVLPPLLLLLS